MMKEGRSNIQVKDLNSVITCRLCEGYLIDATTLIDCLHCFCRACILRYFENNKTACPTCNTIYKKKSQVCFRPDPQIQSLVYKLVPSLYAKEIQRREDFYRSTGVRASSSCSDDSVIERERDMINEQEKMIERYVGDKTQFLSPDDSISLSLEYYQIHLDKTSASERKHRPPIFVVNSESEHELTDTSESTLKTCANDVDNSNRSNVESADCEQKNELNKNKENVVGGTTVDENENKCDKRYLQCPAAVSMRHLQKFVRMKYGLTLDHRVDIIYKGEVLPVDFSLMDVAYTFKWTRTKPLRFFYRIFTPLKIKPIKIVNAVLSNGGKQLQVVPFKTNLEPVKTESSEEISNSSEKKDTVIDKVEQTESEKKEDQRKELFAHLQLKSKTQVEKVKTPQVKECVFEYEEPDQEEIKKFAENRDREWALQKKMDETKKREENYVDYHFTKKRKKNKHSKGEFNLHKKRKLHAEIASNEAELKLKVKITNNGHKHKHHKNSSQGSGKSHSLEMTSKEKLLQMRQIRHKHVPSEDKNFQIGPSAKLSKDISTSTEKVIDENVKESPNNCDVSSVINKEEVKTHFQKPPEDIKKLKIKVSEPSSRVTESAVLPTQQTENTNTSPKLGTHPDSTNSRSGCPAKTSTDKDLNKKVPTVHLERNEQTEKHAQKSFVKTPAVTSEKTRIEKIQTKLDTVRNTQIKTMGLNKLQLKTEMKPDDRKILTSNKLLERKIASLQYQCTIEAKQSDSKTNSVSEKPTLVTPHYPPGFTVSKIEQGTKRKIESEDNIQDKRPSLEITLINPHNLSATIQNNKPMEKNSVKRPPPATIPLEKIKKSVNLKSGISIIPKLPERCDNIGALDLSKPSKSPDILPKCTRSDIPNSFTITTTNRQLNALIRSPNTTTNEKNMGLSNLQMLSKVASEHSTSTTKSNSINSLPFNKPKPQIPNLQTLKIPLPQSQAQLIKGPSLQKMPKLNEIHKFRPNYQIRSMRPNPNQNIRNIPNPSLLNQNRLNSINIQHNISSENATVKSSVNSSSSSATSVSSALVQKESTPPTAVKIVDSKIQEQKEILV